MYPTNWEQFSQLLIQECQFPALVFNQDFKVLLTNQHLLKLLNKNKEVITGQNLSELFPEFNSAQVKTEFLYLDNFIQLKQIHSEDTAQFLGGFLKIIPQDLFNSGEHGPNKRAVPELAKIKEASLSILITQIKERKRIAEKVHNSLGQLLFGFKMEFLQKENGIDPTVNQHMIDLLDVALAETKTIAFELMPAMLEDFGLEATLKELVEKYSSSTFTVSCEIGDFPEKLDRNLEIMIFSIVQELTNNIVKYANASKAQITIEEKLNCIYIKVIDNGVGFEKGELVFAQKSTGLRNIKNSLKLFNGEIKINSQIGKGTLINIQIPLLDLE